MRLPKAHCCPGTTSEKPRLSFSKSLESVPTLCDASEHTAVLAQPQTNPENVHTLCDSPEDTLARRPTTPNIFVSNWSENEHTLCDSPKHTAVLAQHPKKTLNYLSASVPTLCDFPKHTAVMAHTPTIPKSLPKGVCLPKIPKKKLNKQLYVVLQST